MKKVGIWGGGEAGEGWIQRPEGMKGKDGPSGISGCTCDMS